MEDKVQQISAIIGGIYIIARVIVALTPTEADNEWLKKIMSIVSKICFITGLDINQGIKKYGPK